LRRICGGLRRRDQAARSVEWGLGRSQWRSWWLAWRSRKFAIEAALALRGGKLAAGEGHRLEHFFVLELGLGVAALAFSDYACRRWLLTSPIVAILFHCNPAWVNLTAV